MVHSRLHEKQSNPNPHINFITALPTVYRGQQDQDAVQLLRALAAQVRPVMKAHGFVVNSLEEYEYNKVFAGRNWEAGETVELVLRNANGSFASISYILSTLCHELAHIKHMNHGPAFQALWKQISAEVRALQQRGYYGDGYWSAGTRLADSARIGGQGFEMGELPQYMCGGAQPHTKPKPTRPLLPRRRRRHPSTNTQAGPSNHTGRQTAKRRKAGTRVRGEGVFVGAGLALVDSDTTMGTEGMGEGTGMGGMGKAKEGTGFRKQAGSKRAREERALAAERRLRAVQAPTPNEGEGEGEGEGEVKPNPNPPPPQTNFSDHSSSSSSSSSSDESDPEPIQIPETDEDRLKALLESTGGVEEGKTSWGEFKGGFEFGVAPAKEAALSGGMKGAEVLSGGVNGREGVTKEGKGEGQGKGKRKREDGDEYGDADEDVIVISSDSDSDSETQTEIGDLERERERKRGRWDASASKSCDVPSASASGSGATYTMGNGTRNGVEDDIKPTPKPTPKPKPKPKPQQGLRLGTLLQTEIDLRKKEALGMAPPTSTSTSTSKGGGGRKLGKPPSKLEGTSVNVNDNVTGGLSTFESEGKRRGQGPESQDQEWEWECRVCTLINEPMFLACAACATPRS